MENTVNPIRVSCHQSAVRICHQILLIEQSNADRYLWIYLHVLLEFVANLSADC